MTSERRRRRRVLGWGAAGLGALYGVGSLVMVPWVQDDLGDRVSAAAADAGFTGVSADFSGQDGTLRCDAPISSADELEQVAEGVWGVRVAHVDDECVLQAPAPSANPVTSVATTTSPTTTAELPASTAAAPTNATPTTTTTTAAASGLAVSAVIEAGSSRVVLRGTVESEAQLDQLVGEATAAFGADNVVDELVVDDAGGTTGDAQAARLAGLIGVLSPHLVQGRAFADGQELSLEGVYVDAAARAAVEEAAVAAGLDVADLVLSPRAEATVDQAAELEAALNDAVGASPIPFDPNQSTLRPEADAILDQVAALARTYAGVSISVDGHTDGDGSEAVNLALSQARADAVAAALVERGVPPEQLVAAGFGESRPIAPNDTPANKALNRRVVFSVAIR
jgi:OOP family OmpA-OmpF porin